MFQALLRALLVSRSWKVLSQFDLELLGCEITYSVGWKEQTTGGKRLKEEIWRMGEK